MPSCLNQNKDHQNKDKDHQQAGQRVNKPGQVKSPLRVRLPKRERAIFIASYVQLSLLCQICLK